jgi:hypothetical protein
MLEEVRNVRWGRFCFRLWVVTSVAWIIGVFLVMYPDITAPVAPNAELPAVCKSPGARIDCVIAILEQAAKEPGEPTPPSRSVMLERAKPVALLAFLPVLGALLLGFGIRWALAELYRDTR